MLSSQELAARQIKFELLFPAKLRVMHNGNKTPFTDPEEARLYAERLFGQGNNWDTHLKAHRLWEMVRAVNNN